jgi:hypothetical protein
MSGLRIGYAPVEGAARRVGGPLDLIKRVDSSDRRRSHSTESLFYRPKVAETASKTSPELRLEAAEASPPPSSAHNHVAVGRGPLSPYLTCAPTAE